MKKYSPTVQILRLILSLIKEILGLLGILVYSSSDVVRKCPHCKEILPSKFNITCPVCKKKVHNCSQCNKEMAAILYSDTYGFLCKDCSMDIGKKPRRDKDVVITSNSKQSESDEKKEKYRDIQNSVKEIDEMIDKLLDEQALER